DVRGARGRRDWRTFQADQCLVGVVVRVAEVDTLRSRGSERDLVDVEVEILRARLEGLLEWDDDPVDIGIFKAQLLGDGVCDGALESLPRGRVAHLPCRSLRRCPTE